MNDIETIKEIYRQYWICMIEKDTNGLRSMRKKQMAAPWRFHT